MRKKQSDVKLQLHWELKGGEQKQFDKLKKKTEKKKQKKNKLIIVFLRVSDRTIKARKFK